MRNLQRALIQHQASIVLTAMVGCELAGLALAIAGATTMGMSVIGIGMLVLFLGFCLDAVKAGAGTEQDGSAAL